VTCVSKYLKQETMKIFNPAREMEVIYNFIDTSRYKRIRMDDIPGFIKKGEKVLMHISNFRPVKNIPNIIGIFNRVRKHLKARLVLIGEGPEICRARALVEKLDIAGEVFFMDRQENIIPFLSVADIYLLPSKSESFGLSALEAMSCGVPVIGTSEGGLKELVEDGKSGFIFEPDDLDSMSEAALKILTDRQFGEKMKFEARERAKLFDAEIIVPGYESLYRKILND